MTGVIYYLKITIRIALIVSGFIMMIVTKFLLRLDQDKNRTLLLGINKLGHLFIVLALGLILWAVFELFMSDPNV